MQPGRALEHWWAAPGGHRVGPVLGDQDTQDEDRNREKEASVREMRPRHPNPLYFPKSLLRRGDPSVLTARGAGPQKRYGQVRARGSPGPSVTGTESEKSCVWALHFSLARSRKSPEAVSVPSPHLQLPACAPALGPVRDANGLAGPAGAHRRLVNAGEGSGPDEKGDSTSTGEHHCPLRPDTPLRPCPTPEKGSGLRQ